MTWLQVHWDHLMEEMAWMGKEFARSAACRTFHRCACILQPWKAVPTPAKTAPACKPLTAHNVCPHLSLLCRERRWKMTHAKRFAGQIKRSNLDVESRQQVRAKEELQALRKQAAFVGKEVGIQAE